MYFSSIMLVLFLIFCTLAVGVLAQDADSIGPTKTPFCTGNLSVYSFMKYWGTWKGEGSPPDWASPEHITQLKRISCFADCDYQSWAVAEQNSGEWDFSIYRQNADALHAAGVKYIPFCWVHFPPKWFESSPDFVPYQCAEHGEKLVQLSPWSPKVWDIYRAFYAAQHKAMGAEIDWIRIATPSDYGEIGYPAAMTSWLVPQKHAHAGYWCGDPYARADFKSEMKRLFNDLDALNKRWGTSFATWDEVTYPDLVDDKAAKIARESGKATGRRRWLDFVEWYYGVWLRFVPKEAALIREFYPTNPMIVSVGYASENTKFGNDYSAIPNMAKRANLALQTPGNVSYYAVKRVATACHFYGCPYYTEPPGDVPPDAEVARFFSDISAGVEVYFDYPQNLDRARAKLRVYKEHMTGARPFVDFAVFNSTTDHRLGAGADGFPHNSYMLGEKGRERFDYDVVDDYLVKDGILVNYRVLAYVQGKVAEEFALRRIADWVKSGGVLLTCDIGNVETVEGDSSTWELLMLDATAGSVDVKTDGKLDWSKVMASCVKRVGKGLVVRIPFTGDHTELMIEAASRLIYHLSDFGPEFKNAPLIDDAVDGTAATLLPDRILFFNWTDKDIVNPIRLRPEDWSGRKTQPEKMEWDLTIPGHGIVAVPLK